ncbi:transmembrane protein 71 [Misgurnus anguillicaudatus]|uniref:transmembrane protein 71 n=1 Tax=Misgurnus anguillicaudatus TaxID=75329 RepID=UPI002434AA3A|nr:transmembrane protein 71 [Misgurnus anguillicaudatus]XP_055059215.1 transmembrane protein 71 [Misgurnus anguillicaudatus]
MFFRGAVTSSPIKKKSLEPEHVCQSLDLSHFSDSSYECFSTNPLTGSLCACRRSPRLLANGYYLLTEDSFSTDDEGNITLTPSHTSVSYKENLVRIFRRRRRARRSLASLLSDVSQSCQSWLEASVFRRSDPVTPLQSSSWMDLDHTCEQDAPISFTYDTTEHVSSPDKETPQTLLEEEGPQTESCSPHDQCSQSVSGLLDVPPPSIYQHNSYSSSTKTSSDTFLLKVLLFILILCLCIAISSRWLLGGVSAAVAFFVLLSSLCVSKPGTAIHWRRAKTEDITSRNE